MSLIQEIRDYTAAHAELRNSHHFLFDLPSQPDGPTDFILMGLNPGENKRKDQQERGDGILREETREQDFRDPKTGYRNFFGKELKRELTKWYRRAVIIGGSTHFTQTEFFFWCSPNVSGSVFEKSFGTRFKDSPHLDFCVRQNKALINKRKPKYVIVAALGYRKFIASKFGLRGPTSQFPSDDIRAKSYSYIDDNDTKWFFVKHLTGARGVRREYYTEVAAFIRRETKAP